MATDREDSAQPGDEPGGHDPALPADADDLRGIAEEISALYPPPRLGTELVLLEITPHRAHAYWNLDVEDFVAGKKASGLEHPPMVIRLRDVTPTSGPRADTAWDVEVQGLQGHWYLDLWNPGRTHIAQLGFRRNDGSLVPLAESNPVSTPPAGESPDYDTIAINTAEPGPPPLRLTDLIADPNLTERTMDAETGVFLDDAPPQEPTRAFAPPAAPVSGPAVEASVTAPIAPARDVTPAGVPPPVLKPEFPLPPFPNLVEGPRISEPPVGDVAAYFQDVVETATPANSNIESIAAAAAAGQPWRAPDMPPPRSNAAERGVDLSGWPSADDTSKHVAASPAEPPAESPFPAVPHAIPAAPERPPTSEPPAKPAPPASLPLDSYVTVSSMETGRREVAIEVNVELHIYGRARPGTEVTLYGQRIPLSPDGTFSVRKPLPHGAVVLPLLAVDPPPST